MKSSLTNSVLLLLPLFISLALFTFAIFGKILLFDLAEDVEISFFFVAIDFKIQAFHLQLASLVAGVLVLSYIPFRNHSRFFPRHLKMVVSFDEKGILERIARLPQKTAKKYPFRRDWKKQRKLFFKSIDELVSTVAPKESLTKGDVAEMVARGQTTFFVEKCAVKQRYKIVEAEGHLVIDGGTLEKGIETQFLLRDTEKSFFSISLIDLFWGWSFVVDPVFTQKFRVNPANEKSFENLIAVTVVHFFPVITIEDTLYFLKRGERFVPIGYCAYTY